jgi:hypothetical protein
MAQQALRIARYRLIARHFEVGAWVFALNDFVRCS